MDTETQQDDEAEVEEAEAQQSGERPKNLRSQQSFHNILFSSSNKVRRTLTTGLSTSGGHGRHAKVPPTNSSHRGAPKYFTCE